MSEDVSEGGSSGFDIVSILGGTNDLWRLKPEEVLVNIEQCVDVVGNYRSSAQILLSTVPTFDPGFLKWFAFMDFPAKVEACRIQYNSMLREMAKDNHRCSLVDLDKALDGRRGARHSDGIHLSPAGYELFSSLIYDGMARGKTASGAATRETKEGWDRG